jgi:Tol biopolymer transport system component
VLQGWSFLGNGVVYGQGIRCVGGSLKRLYVKTASGGSITAPETGDVPVSAQSAAKGDTILAGQSRWYLVYYRDPIVPGGLRGCEHVQLHADGSGAVAALRFRYAIVPIAAALAPMAGAQTTTLVTHGVSGQSDAGSLYAEISADGRFVAYQSAATNLVPNDTNGVPDVFLYDVATGTTIRVSVDSAGNQGNDDCLEPALSLDGRFVAIFAYATNLVPGDTNGKPDIFVRDVQAGTTVRASLGAGGVESDGASRYPSISRDGRFVAFESQGTNLVPSDANGARDVFVRDLVAGTTVRASESAAGVEGDGDSLDASISPDGRFVAFESVATNLVPGDGNGASDVFVKDLQTGAIVRVSVDSSGNEGQRPQPRPVALPTSVSPCPSRARPRTSSRATGTGTRISSSTTSSRGRRSGRASRRRGRRRTPARTTGRSPRTGGTWRSSAWPRTSSRPTRTRASTSSCATSWRGRRSASASARSGSRATGTASTPAISPGGRYVAFDSWSENLVVGDANLVRDIFLHDRYSPFRPFCAGDGSLPTSCPCGNLGFAGHGCYNSSVPAGRVARRERRDEPRHGAAERGRRAADGAVRSSCRATRASRRGSRSATACAACRGR